MSTRKGKEIIKEKRKSKKADLDYKSKYRFKNTLKQKTLMLCFEVNVSFG
jgi:hypothetical protein